MNKVFIGGSRRLSRLNSDVRHRLDNIIETGLTVLVGDANGADKAVQEYLADKRYNNVIVFCSGSRCRNNVGSWPARHLSQPQQVRRDFAYYAAKDRAMVDETDYGLMLWDGESRGTLTSVVDLTRQGKPVVVYVSPRKSFETLKSSNDLGVLVGRTAPDLLRRIDEDLQAAGRRPPTTTGEPPSNLSLF
jgi:hypothetical protein